MSTQTSDSDDRFDDHLEREAMARYCKARNYTYMYSDKHAPVDMFATAPNGKRIALELTRNAIWTMQPFYPTETVHVPLRKWKTFREQTQNISHKNVVRAELAYLVVLNTDRTRALLMAFDDIVADLELFDTEVLSIYNSPDKFVHIPISYAKRYIDIPPAEV